MSSSEFLGTIIPQIILSILHNFVDFVVIYLMERIHGYEIYEYLIQVNS